MVQILPRQPSTFEKIIGPMSEGIGNVAQGLVQRQQQQKQKVENDQRSKALVALGIPEMVAKEAVRNPDIMKSLLENQMLEERAARIMGTSAGGRKEDSFDGLGGQGRPDGEMSSGGGLTGKPASGLQAQSDEQLGALTGIKGYSEPAKAELRRRQEERKLSQSHFEPTEEKLEAERQSKFADEIIKDYNAAQSSEKDLNQMIALAKSKKLSTPLMVKSLNTLGIPISILQNPLTEAYQKLENNFVKNVSDYFPGQVRVYEAQTYMKTIPSLLNSDEGKEIVAKNLQLEDKAKKLRYEAYKDIINENKGKKPRNLDIQVLERTKNEMKKLGDEFQKNMETAIEMYGPKITMYSPDRKTRYEIPQNKIDEALKEGAVF
jgi:hypothetical protein